MNSTVTRIENVQYLRGIAALAVALAHIASLQHSLAPNTSPVLPEFNGFWGVDIFFVISGFIIVYITRDIEASGRAATLFMLKRAVRIVPAYWAFTVLIYFSDTQHWFSDQPNLTNVAMLIKSLLFVKPGFPLLFVGWTLTLEMFFYVLYALMLWRFNAVVRVWLVALFLASLTVLPILIGQENRYIKFYTQTILLEFVVGMLIAYFCFMKQKQLPQVVACTSFIIGWLLLACVTFYQKDEVLIFHRAFWWGIPALLIVLGAVNMQLFCKSKVLSFSGAVSYSLYLCHMPCAYLATLLAKKYFTDSVYFLLAYLIFAMVLTAIFTIISWRLLECVPQQILRRSLRGAA